MVNDEGKIYYGIGLDNEQLAQDAERSKKLISGIGDKTQAEGSRIDKTFVKLGGIMAGVFTMQKAGQYIQQIARVRGEFQQLEVAFKTMLGSKKEADLLMDRTIDFAARTPFDLTGVAQGTKQLLAYGSQAESVTEELRMLGNIAAGLSIPLNDIVYLYGTTRTQGRLYTMDMRQFMGRGIPLAEELSKQFGVAKDRVGELVTEGKVGFPQVEMALRSMTSEGGKFYNLMEEQSKTITGKMSNLGDAVQQMNNAIGKSLEKVINAGLDSASWAVEHYKEIGNLIGGLVVSYGAYRAALITFNAVRRVSNNLLKEAVIQKSIAALAGSKLTTNEAMQAAVTLRLARAKRSLIATLKALNKVILSNPYILAAAAVAALALAIYKLATQQSAAERATQKYREEQERLKEQSEALKNKTNELIAAIKEEAATRYMQTKAFRELQELYPGLLDNYSIEKILLTDTLTLQRLINKEIERRNFENLIADIRTTETELNKLLTTGTVSDDKGRYMRQIEDTTERLRLLRQELVNIQALRWDSLPLTTRTAGLNIQIETLRSEIATLEQELTQTEATPFDLATKMLKQGQLDTARQRLKAMQSMLDAMTESSTASEIENKTFWEAKQKAAQEALEALPAIERGTKRWIELESQILKAQEMVNLYTIKPTDPGEEPATPDSRKNKAYWEGILETARKAKEAIDVEMQGTAEWKALEARILEAQAKIDSYAEKKQKEPEYTLDDLLLQYETLAQGLDRINKKYDDQRKLFDENSETFADNIKKLEAERRRELSEYTADIIGETDLWKRLMGDLSGMSAGTLELLITQAEQAVKTSTSLSVEEINEMMDALRSAQQELAARNPFDVLVTSFGKYKQATEQEDKDRYFALFLTAADKAEDMIHSIGDSAADLASVFDEALGETFRDITSSLLQAKSLLTSVAKASKEIEEVGELSQMVKADILTTALAIFTKLIEKFIELGQHEEIKDAAQFANQYALALLKLDAMDYDTLFGTKSIAKAADAWELAQSALERYQTAVKDSTIDTAELYRQVEDGTITIYEAIALMWEATNTIQNIKVKTNDYSAWENFWGKKDEYTYLRDYSVTMPDGTQGQLFDQQGNFNVEAARIFLDTNTQITDEQRQQIQNAIDLHDTYKELNKVIDDTISQTFSQLGGQIADVIWDSVMSGADAWQGFQDIGAEVISKLGKQLIEEMVVTTYLEGFQQQMRQAYSLGDPQAIQMELMRIMDSILSGLGTALDSGAATAEMLKQWSAEKGYDLTDIAGNTARTAVTKGITQASQQSVDELSGRATAIQGHTYAINENTRQLTQHAAHMLEYLSGIETNTRSLSRLQTIEGSIKGIDNSLNDIKTKGITIK